MNEDVMAGLRARFRERASRERDALVALLAAGRAQDRETLAIVHGLAGAAAMFGFPAIGDAAGALDDIYARGETPGDFTLLLAALSAID